MALELTDSPRANRLARMLRLGIQRGEWPVGSALPTTRQLAQNYQVGLTTVRKVLEELESQGLIERRPRQGTVVKTRTPSLATPGQSLQQIALVGRAEFGDADSWAYRITKSMEAALWAHDLQPISLPFDPADDDPSQRLADQIEAMGLGVIGVVIFNTPAMRPLPALLDQLGMPWVSINRMEPNQSHNFVAADNLMGCRLVGECLARMNRLRVLALMANGVNVSETESEKITGLIQGFLHADAPINGIDYVKCREDSRGYEMTRNYIRKQGPPQAIFALTDQMASGAMTACVDAGLHVPDDVQVIGAAGLELARHTRPRLTVITQPMEAIGREACEMIRSMIVNDVRRMEPRRICGQFIVRESLPVPEPVLNKLEQRFPEMIERD